MAIQAFEESERTYRELFVESNDPKYLGAANEAVHQTFTPTYELGKALYLDSQFAESAEILNRGREVANRVGNPQMAAVYALKLSKALSRLIEEELIVNTSQIPPGLLEQLGKASAEWQRQGNLDLAVEAKTAQGILSAHSGALDVASHLYGEALSLCDDGRFTKSRLRESIFSLIGDLEQTKGFVSKTDGLKN